MAASPHTAGLNGLVLIAECIDEAGPAEHGAVHVVNANSQGLGEFVREAIADAIRRVASANADLPCLQMTSRKAETAKSK